MPMILLRKAMKMKGSSVSGYVRASGVAVSPYLRRVAEYADKAHEGQTRKDAAKTPYISHPLKVASILRHVGGVKDESVLAAAMLHDTVEDTHVTHDDLVSEFGKHVAGLVGECTDDKDLPKDERKRLQVEHAPHKSESAALVKIGDKIANLKDLIDSPPPDWPKARIREYFEWSKSVVDGLKLNNKNLRDEFEKIYSEGLLKL